MNWWTGEIIQDSKIFQVAWFQRQSLYYGRGMSWSQAKAAAHKEWKRRNRGNKAGEAADVSLRSRSPARRATAKEPSAIELVT